MAEAKPKRASKGKQHPLRASTLVEISDKLKEHAKNPLVDTNSPSALLKLIADVFGSAGTKVRKILR